MAQIGMNPHPSLYPLIPVADGNSMDTPMSPPPASGNGVIAQPKKVRGVGFGDIFSEGSLKLKVRLPSPDTEEKKERVSV